MTKREQKHFDKLNSVSKQSNTSLLKDLKIQQYGDFKNRKKRIKSFGINKIKKEKFEYFKTLFYSLIEPFSVLLFLMFIADIVIYFTLEKTFDHIVGAIVTIALLSVTLLISYVIKFSTWKINYELQKMISNQSTIVKHQIEDYQDIHLEVIKQDFETILTNNITKGDTIFLREGDIVPADIRIIWSENLVVDDAYIRGEVKKIRKSAEYKESNQIYDLNNILLSESSITKGMCIGVVFNIRDENTGYLFIKREENSALSYFEKGMKYITKFLIGCVFIIFPTILLSTYFSSNDQGSSMWIASALFAITVVIGIIPEGLPGMISFNLIRGSKKIKDENIIIKNFGAIQDIGSVDVLFSSMNENIIKDRPMFIDWLNSDLQKDENIFELLYVASYFQNNFNHKLENAILSYEETVIDEIIKKYEIVESKVLIDKNIVSTKLISNGIEKNYFHGLINPMFEKLQYKRINNKVKELTVIEKNKIWREIEQYSANGNRILILSSWEKECEEGSLIFEGLGLFKDLIHEDVAEGLALLEKYNIDFKMLSTDNSYISKWAANEIGLKNVETISGADLVNIPKKELKVLIKTIDVFTELNQYQRATIIYNYKENKHVVAYLGNGYSDVVAIKRADVGITLNNASGVAKAFSDIIMNEKKLSNLDNAFLIGRQVLVNSIKYVQSTITINLAMFLAVLSAGIWFPFLPLNSNQLLLQTLMFDIANIGFLFDKVDPNIIIKPIKWSRLKIIRFVLINAILPYIISMANLAILSYDFNLLTDSLTSHDIAGKQLQTAFYLESYITHVVLYYVWRTKKVSFVKDNPPIIFNIMILVASAFVLSFALVPKVNDVFEMHPPQAEWWGVMAVTIIVAWGLGELIKFGYIKTFKTLY